ncbi:MAG: signal peptidase I [Ruminococcus sp.]|nr:signal peptidase I [Ruminococcus sp.]
MDNENKFGEVNEEDVKLASEAAPEDIKEKPPVDLKNEILEWCESFVFAMFIVILIFTFFFRIVKVEGESMTDTLQDKDRLIMTHLNYTPEKDDIVVINSTFLNKTIIKRVIGTEGDHVTVDYNSNTVTVNGEKIADEHIKEVMFDTGLFDPSYKTSEGVYEYDVPEDYIFVMGDNRNGSKDSRYIGFVEEDSVLGKAVFRLFPFNAFGSVD